MLLPFGVLVSRGGGCFHRSVHGYVLLPEIKECEDEYPHQIDEVPVQARDLHGLVSALAVIESCPDPPGYDCQIDHACRDVQAVETGDHEKRRPELRRTPGIAPRTDSFGDE